jgi:hypothetical protein
VNFDAKILGQKVTSSNSSFIVRAEQELDRKKQEKVGFEAGASFDVYGNFHYNQA